jgi:hypothetical protein
MEKDEEYNIKRDNLDFGHAGADYLIDKYGSIENIPKSVGANNEKLNPLEKTIDILKSTPVDLINFGNGKAFERVLKRVAKTGYVIKNSYGIPVNDFSIIDPPKNREIYISLMKELGFLNKNG